MRRKPLVTRWAYSFVNGIVVTGGGRYLGSGGPGVEEVYVYSNQMPKIISIPEIRITLDLATLHLSASGRVLGYMAVVFRGEPFPDADWSDFAVIVFNMWLVNALDLWEGGESWTKLHFMDGPFWVEIESRDGTWRVCGVNDRGNSPARTVPVDVEPREMLSMIVSWTDHLLAECKKRGWSSDDIADLDSSNARAHRALRQA
jgi:hypothetical protein